MYYLTTDDDDDVLNNFQYTLYKLDLCDFVTTLVPNNDHYARMVPM
jgi:hypothetical protein